MDRAIDISALRLAGSVAGEVGAPRTDDLRRSVAEENRSAAALPIDDARRIFALRVSELMQGGRAAVLTPEHRRRLVMLGQRLGLRAFDANLVIAIVQDGARRGENVAGSVAVDRLRLTPTPGAKKERASVALVALPAAAIALIALIALIAWITGE